MEISTATTQPITRGVFKEWEFRELEQKLEEIGAVLPTHLTDYIWSTYVKAKGANEPKPCTCKSSGGLWAGAVEYLREYVKNNR